MTRLFCVGIVVAAVLFAVPAFASVPFPDNCHVQWFQPVGTDIIIVCPSIVDVGDGTMSFFDVWVNDQFDLPIPGVVVTASFASASVCADPISGITDAGGYVRLAIPAGVASGPGGGPRITSGYTVTAVGYTIKTGNVTILSPEYDCLPAGGLAKVNALDYSYFALDWGLVPVATPRSDFNNDNTMNALDYSIWAQHYRHPLVRP